MSGRTYVNNSKNKSLGRVGMPVGSCVNSSGRSDNGSSALLALAWLASQTSSASGYVGGSSLSSASSTSSSTQRCYADNASNRNLGRVGKQVGSHVLHKDGSTTGSTTVSGTTWPDAPLRLVQPHLRGSFLVRPHFRFSKKKFLKLLGLDRS